MKNINTLSNTIKTLKVESQNILDPVLAKPESWYKARF